MAERVVKVRLAAVVADYEKSMRDAANATATVGTEAEKLAQKKQAFNQLGASGLAMGAVLSAGLAVATKASMDFDAQMSNVQAATHETAANMALLRQAALDAGESTVFSATESAQAIEELSKAGVSTSDILGGGLAGALDLAAAGGLDVATAAGIAATSLQQFNLEGSDMSHVADLLAAGAGKAMGDVTDLSQALNQSALVAKQTGLSIEETTAGLAAFASAGLLGSDAGTSFKTMLQALNPTSAQAAALMEKYNLQAYDAQGNFVGLSEYAGRLKDGLSGLSTEQQNATLKTIFGADAVRAATVLYQQGAEGIEKWTDEVNDQGYAASTAAMRLDNLKGDVEALGGAFETALIDTGSTANDTLRTMVQALTGLIGMYNDLPEPVQASVMALGGAAAAVALTGGAAFLAVPKWLEFKATVEASTWTMKGIGLTAGAAGLALGGLFLIVGELASQQQKAQARAQAYAASIEEGTNKLSDAARSTAIDELQKGGELLSFNWQSAFDAAEKLGVGADVVTDAALRNSDAIDQLSTYYDALNGDQEAFNRIQEETGMNAYETRAALEAMIGGIQKQNGAIDDAIRLKEQEKEANSTSASQTKSAADAYLEEAGAVQHLQSQLSELIDTINAANGVGQDAVTQNIRYQEALAAVNEAITKGAYGLDISTDAGRANMDMLVGLASDSQAAAQAQFELDGSTQGYTERMRAGREALINSAIQMGATRAQAEALADQIYAIPSEKDIQVLAQTAQAQTAIDNFVNRNMNKTINVWLNPKTQAMNDAFAQYLQGHATGGPVIGPGTGTSDSIVRRLSNGEHVLTAADVQAMGGQEAVMQMRASLHSGTAAEPVWVRSGQEFGMFSGTPGQSGALPAVYVQNPFTGEYLLAEVSTVASGVVQKYDDARSRVTRGRVR
ncbi:phage tail tape measure protein [Microbacterium sp. SSW1-47]|uniref:phage tail tape measure protein n=1 Tax=Microbacterium sufflavum TaxID=2851649 RepID=UPI001FFCC17F|nr:phage tail tape measure protein [Microbacterium sufflavum]MCK2025093.1 phage tail tape measure protein [Microbacterium sufflavum]